MKQIKTIFGYIYQAKVIVFALALYNFISLWFAYIRIADYGALAPPWYADWSYTNEPSILLLAASFLFINKFWSYLSSVVLSGFVIAKAAYLVNNFGLIEWFQSLFKQWEFRHEYELDILKMWEIQLVLAVIVFSTAIFYLFRKTVSKNTLR